MAVFSARERLSRLVELAGQEGIEARRALAGELADLLLSWPSIYPRGMREPFEALLEKTVRDIGPAERAMLADRFIAADDMPLSILNLLVFDAAPETKHAILHRNAASAETAAAVARIPVNEAALLAAARGTSIENLPAVLAPRLGIGVEIVRSVLEDSSGAMLAVLCKGSDMRRQTCSALAVLTQRDVASEESYRRLAAYDDMPEPGSKALVRWWRSQALAPSSDAEAA
jgi:hypothetical protein